MRKEVFRLWHLLQRRENLMEDACSLGSPGFEAHYGSGYCTGAGFEDKVAAACDLDEEIVDAVEAIVIGIEQDDAALLKFTGQTQRILRLRYLCGKGEKEIAKILGISVRTVDRRIEDHECTDEDSIIYAPIDVLIEEHILKNYEELAEIIGYPMIGAEIHETRARNLRTRYNTWLDSLDERSKEIYAGRRKGAKWDDIAKGVGLSSRQTRRLYEQMQEKD